LKPNWHFSSRPTKCAENRTTRGDHHVSPLAGARTGCLGEVTDDVPGDVVAEVKAARAVSLEVVKQLCARPVAAADRPVGAAFPPGHRTPT
jgi:hypothetical protein